MNISVLGAGGWGTALANLLNSNKHKTILWEFDKEYAHTLDEFRENFYFLPKVKIPRQIIITNDLERAVHNSEMIVIATPTQYIRSVIERIKDIDLTGRILLSVSKGIENNSFMTVSEIFQDVFTKIKKRNIAVLSGPSHAEEVSRQLPTAVVASSSDSKNAEIVQKVFSNQYFRVYRSNDVC
jgi:glycerol-3-phosphate dehydrogenase (NAD(P)+)